MAEKSPIFVQTPLLYSSKLSKLSKAEVYLKLENTQPSGSFKLRGCGFHCQQEVERGCKRLITASGGNAGLAVARAGNILGVPVSVFIPKSAPKLVIDILREQGAEVIIHGDNFGMAHELALVESEKPGNSYIHPYLHKEVWFGHSTMVDEIKQQLGPDVTPGCFIVSVGGGGLIKGVLAGMKRNGWAQVPVIAVETEGANCMQRALEAGKPVEMNEITSIACLGAKVIMPDLFDELPNFNVIHHAVTDQQAVQSCLRFADDHRMLVEPACGAPLSILYCKLLKQLLLEEVSGPIVLVICGGAGVSMALLEQWANQFGLDFPYKEK